MENGKVRRETVETVKTRRFGPNTLLKQGVNESVASTKFATKFTTKVIPEPPYVGCYQLFNAHNPDYVHVGRGMVGAGGGEDAGEGDIGVVVVAADGGEIGPEIDGVRVGGCATGAARRGIAAQEFVVAVEVRDDLAVVNTGGIGQGLAVALDKLGGKCGCVREGFVPWDDCSNGDAAYGARNIGDIA